MDATIPTPSDCSTVSTSSVSLQEPPPSTPFHLLEITLISAQDLAPVNKSMRTYAVAWTNIDPSRRLQTRTNPHGHTRPTWNQKLTFRISPEFLLSEDSSINVEIYTTSWLRETLVGTVRVLISDLLAPPPSSSSDDQPHPQLNKNIRFVALQIRRPSGTPQGILNMGVALLDSSANPPPRNPSGEDLRQEIERKVNALSLEERDKKIHLLRSLSVGSEANDGLGHNSGSELCSDIGPSASIVAADLARKSQPPPQAVVARRPEWEDAGSSILGEMTMEEAREKGYRIRSRRERWRELDDRSDLSSEYSGYSHPRRKSDSGLFTCFGTAYGIEFRIVCGTPANNPTGNRKMINGNANSVSTSRKSTKSSENGSEQIN